MERSSWRWCGVAAGVVVLFGAGVPAPAHSAGLWEGGCLFGFRPGLDALTAGYNPTPAPAYCPSPTGAYPAPVGALPEPLPGPLPETLRRAAPTRYYCEHSAAGIGGDRLSQLSGVLCGGSGLAGDLGSIRLTPR